MQSSSASTSNVHVATPVVAPRLTSLPGSSTKKAQTMNVKVIQATIKRLPGGRCEFCHIGQTFVDIIESTANVHYIRSAVQKRWGSDHVLVTADGLEIEDCSGTQGIYIWIIYPYTYALAWPLFLLLYHVIDMWTC